MYFDLYHGFPLADDAEDGGSKKGKKGKGKAVPQQASAAAIASGQKRKDCWEGLESADKDKFAKRLALAGHLGYSVVGCTIAPTDPATSVIPSPFTSTLPFPDLDPRFGASAQAGPSGSGSGSSTNPGRPPMVQVTRYHIRLNDNKHPLTNQNTAALRAYDILSVAPTTDKAFQLACSDMSNPGPNQISIITLPLHERPFTFRYNRKQMRQAQRNGVVFELLYSAALFPSPSLPPDIARRYRQNFLSNGKEVVRITGGKGVIFSSGPGGSDIGLRGPLDIVNLGTMLGMPSNIAKEAVEKAPKMVLLRAQARRTFKAIMSTPRLVPAPGAPGAEHESVIGRSSHEDGEGVETANKEVEMDEVVAAKRSGEEIIQGARAKKAKKAKGQ